MPEQPTRDLPEDAPKTSGKIVDVDFNAPVGRPTGLSASIQSYSSPDTFVPHKDFFAARDALIQKLGIFSAKSGVQLLSTNPNLSGLENIVGVGVGFRETNNRLSSEVAIKVLVKEKKALAQLDEAAKIPSTLSGIATDVQAVGETVLQSFAQYYPRPVKCGVSCGHFQLQGSGTLGCVAVLNNNKRVILSNSHVLALQGTATIGDAIIQPGVGDPVPSPTPADLKIALLENFVPLQATGNLVDAAVAWTNPARVDAGFMTYTLNPTPVQATLGMTVMKNGRTTQSTLGTITGMGFTLSIFYDLLGQTLSFQDQIVITGLGGPFSMPGDSGSLIVTAGTQQPVALLFAGPSDNSVTYGNLIQHVIDLLDIREFLAS